MFKVLKLTVIAICCLMLVLMFMPTGSSVDDVVAGYQSTLSYATSEAMVYQYMETIKPGDPLLDKVQENVGEHVDYLWVLEDGTHVQQHMSDSFPTRGGKDLGWQDHTTGAVKHSGTDYGAPDSMNQTVPLYQVSLWGGTVEYTSDDDLAYKGKKPPYNDLRGREIVVNCGNGFYVRYQHLAFGGILAPKWQRGKSGSSILVKKGDKVRPGQKIALLGMTGKGSGPHAHIELMLYPQGYSHSGSYWAGGVANILQGGKKLNEITWYKFAWPDHQHAHIEGTSSYDEIFGD